MTVQKFQDFESAGKATLAFLHNKFGFGLWMVTRTRGNDWIVLQSEDHGYGVAPGKVFNWADTFCSEMVKGNGPRIAPDSDSVPVYAAAQIGKQIPIRAYIGAPLTSADGELFGTLCAIDPVRQPDALVADQDLIELLATMLSTILSAELRVAEESRRSERLAVEALVDPMTNLSNRRAWDQLVTREEERCRRYGHAATVFVIDLDSLKQLNDDVGHSAGDALILLAAEALRDIAREIDIVARLGGDEFGVVAVECDSAGADIVLERIRDAFAIRKVDASVGFAIRNPETGITVAWENADANMYAEKKAKRNPHRVSA